MDKAGSQVCVDALSALVQSLRTIQIAQGDRSWLVLDLTMSQLKAVLLLVRSGGLRSRELADGLGVGPSAATPLVDRLVRQKLARRDHDARDRRIVLIRPTARAIALYDRLMRMKRSVCADVFAELPAVDRRRVCDAVQRLLEAAERVLARNVTSG
jgi:DNA-binding MarR family transcriptional regulator